MSKPIDVWFHCWCGNEKFFVQNSRIFRYCVDKINKMKNSGLYDAVSNFYIVAHGSTYKNEFIFEDLKSIFPKIKVIKMEKTEIGHESDTLNLMLSKYKNEEQEYNVLFFHTKGFSYPEIPTQQNWIRYLDLFMINKWKENQEILKTHDCNGIFFFEPDEASRKAGEPDNRKTYAGWFWWANSSHLKKIDYFTHRMDRGKGGEFSLITPECKYHVMETGIPTTVDLHREVWCDEKIFPVGW